MFGAYPCSGPLNSFWQSFVASHSNISLNVVLGDPDEDVISNQVDIAIRSGPQQNSSLIQKKIGTITPILVISSRIKTNSPDEISDLDRFPSIAAQLFSDWTLCNGDDMRSLHKKHNHLSNDMNITLNLVKAGAGIALLPMSMVYREIESGELTRVLPSWNGVPREISILWPKSRTLSARAKLFRDELVTFLANQGWFNAH